MPDAPFDRLRERQEVELVETMLDAGYLMLDAGCWMLAGNCQITQHCDLYEVTFL